MARGVPPDDTESVRVLVVTDDREDGRSIASALGDTDVPLEVAITEEAGVVFDRADAEAVECVFCTAARAGFELLETIQRRFPQLPVVLGSDDAVDAVAAIDAGAVDYVSLPTETDRVPVIARRLYSYGRQYRSEQTADELRSIFEALPDAVVVHDDDGCYHRVNQEACELLGYDREELLERTVHDIEVASSREELESFWRDCDPGESVTREGRHRQADGTEFPVRVNVCRIDHDEPRFVMSIREIAELREREAHLEQAQTVGNIGSWSRDVRSDESYWSDEVYEIFGVDDREGLIDHETFMDYVHPDDRDAVEAEWTAVLTGEPYDVEHRIVTEDGETKWVRERAQIEFDDDGEPTSALGVVQDITERKRRERQLEEQNERLEVFNRIIRHDLRNQLNVIAGYASTLAERSDDESAERAGRIHDAAVDLLSISEQLRQVNRLVGDGDRRRTVDVSLLVEDAVESVQETHDEFECETRLPDPVKVEGIEGIRLAIENVVENAVEHNDADRPRVEVTLDDCDENSVEVCVADNGPGIPETELKVITGDRERSQLEHATGVGLLTANWIVSSVGGELEFDTDRTEGTAVRFRLPRADVGTEVRNADA